MNIQDYYTELMNQSFVDSIGTNFTNYALMLFIKKNNYVFEARLLEVTKYIYRFYIDNPGLSKLNSNIIIRNISKYSPADIQDYVVETIDIWIKNGKGVLKFNSKDKIISIRDLFITDNDKELLNTVIDAICLKYSDKIISYDPDISDDVSGLMYSKNNDYFALINKLNSTRYSNRAFEDCKYCVCCEDVDREHLLAVPIDSEKSLTDGNNSIILCKEHAKLYINNYFRFSDKGKIIIFKPHDLLDKRMHLSFSQTKSKKAYLEESVKSKGKE